jgi:catechol 2,3-dioxygenase-like lactoylglutathione lyase family enzyme
MRVHHVNLVVPIGGTADVLAFWQDVFGFAPVPKPAGTGPGGAWLQIDDATQLHLSERDGAPHPDAHVALVVDDLDDVRRRLAARGAPFEPAPPVFGGPRGFTRDPAGNRVELLGK